MMHKVLFIFVLILVFPACREDDFGEIPVDIATGWFPTAPVNISNLNTTFDDFGSDINASGERIHLYYSNNVEKRGSDFDIKGVNIDVVLNKSEDKMRLDISNSTPPNSTQLLPLINTTANELGPFSFNDNFGSDWYFFYANDEKGQYDIKYVYKTSSGGNLKGPYDAKVLNSNVCEYYATINYNQSKVLFSSYRKGKYDLYEIDIEGDDFTNWLDTGENTAVLNQTMSSNEYDKCPYIRGNLLVFASNRPGGFGAYDLWYSILENGEWSSPINFGPEINTEHDEFRPAIEYFPESNNDFMIFSSNRPEGKGSYDLYFAGIPKMIQ